MNDPLKETYCCCQIFPIKNGVFLIAMHSFFQGTYGLLVVITSYYKKKDPILNIIVVAANTCFFPAGILLFGTTLYNSYVAARISAAFFTFITFVNYCASFCYIIWYNEFMANSAMDKALFWKDEHDWVSDGNLPFTVWHILAYSTSLFLTIWWYYSLQAWRFATLLKMKNDTGLRNTEPVPTVRDTGYNF